MGADKDIVRWEAHDAFQFVHLQHPHTDVDDVIQGHELLYLDGHRRVVLEDGNADTLLGGDEIGRHFVHAGDEGETRLVDAATGTVELGVHEVLLDRHQFLLGCWHHSGIGLVKA